jgi:hypothetical protein
MLFSGENSKDSKDGEFMKPEQLMVESCSRTQRSLAWDMSSSLALAFEDVCNDSDNNERTGSLDNKVRKGMDLR